MRGVVAIAWLMVLSGCEPTAPSPSYFPLNNGFSWVYRETRTNGAGQEQAIREVRVAPSVTYDNQQLQVRRWSDGIDFLFKQDSTGIYRRAKRTFLEWVPRFDAERRYVLKTPLEVGNSWTHDTHRYLLWRPGPMKFDYARARTMQMSYTIYVYLVENCVKPVLSDAPDQSILAGEAPNFHELAGILDGRLTNSRWLCGATPTIADIAAAAPMHLHA